MQEWNSKLVRAVYHRSLRSLFLYRNWKEASREAEATVAALVRLKLDKVDECEVILVALAGVIGQMTCDQMRGCQSRGVAHGAYLASCRDSAVYDIAEWLQFETTRWFWGIIPIQSDTVEVWEYSLAQSFEKYFPNYLRTIH